MHTYVSSFVSRVSGAQGERLNLTCHIEYGDAYLQARLEQMGEWIHLLGDSTAAFFEMVELTVVRSLARHQSCTFLQSILCNL